MFLTATNLFSYLDDVGLATPADIVDEQFTLFEIGRRNRNFRVVRPAGASLFVKQVPLMVPETRLALLREAACGQLVLEEPLLPALAAVAPRLCRYDPTHNVLVHVALADAQSLADLLLLPSGIASDLVGATAATLGQIHVESAQPGSLARVASVLTGEAPWVFDVAARAEVLMPGMEGASRAVVQAIRSTPVLLQGLTELGTHWRRVCLMHGDLKWDNILVAAGGADDAADGARQLHLVDWELCNLGDPLWDLAGLVAALLQVWMLGRPIGGASSARTSRAGDVPLHLIQEAAVHAFAGYARAARQFVADPASCRLLARLTGARMVLMAFELSQKGEQLPREAGMALALAQYFLGDPDHALAELLGPPAAAAWSALLASSSQPGPVPWRLPARAAAVAAPGAAS